MFNKIESTNIILSFESQASIPESDSSLLPNINEKIKINEPIQIANLHEKTISYLNRLDEKLDSKIPDFEFQKKIDQIGNYIKKKFEPFTKLNGWLDQHSRGIWYQQIALFLAKLPLKAVRNIVCLIYNIIKEAVHATVHPLKALNRLAKFIVDLTYALTQPEVWSKIGSGLIGGCLGQSLVSGNPLSLIGLGIGTAMIIGGVSIGALKAALNAEKGLRLTAVKQNIFFQTQQIPETMLTGFCMGLIMGSIQRLAYKQTAKYRVTDYELAKSHADKIVKDHHLPNYSKVKLDSSGKISIDWIGKENIYKFNSMNPQIFSLDDWNIVQMIKGVKMELQSNGASKMSVHFYAWDGFEGHNFTRAAALKDFGLYGQMYPIHPANEAFNHLGFLTGCTNLFQSAINEPNKSH